MATAGPVEQSKLPPCVFGPQVGTSFSPRIVRTGTWMALVASVVTSARTSLRLSSDADTTSLLSSSLAHFANYLAELFARYLSHGSASETRAHLFFSV